MILFQKPPVKSETFFESIQSLKTGNAILDAILPVVIIACVTYLFIILGRWFLPSATVKSFDKNELKRAKVNFIPNHIKLFNQDSDDITPTEFKNSDDSLYSLIEFIKKSDQKYFFLIAPTGIGKTTFLINFYLRYKKKSWLSLKNR